MSVVHERKVEKPIGLSKHVKACKLGARLQGTGMMTALLDCPFSHIDTFLKSFEIRYKNKTEKFFLEVSELVFHNVVVLILS